LLNGLGISSAALGKHAHVEAVHVVLALRLVGRALLCRHVAHALEDQVLRALVQHQRPPERGRGALARVVVRGGADAAA
jgi:hypothetical protein